MIAVEFVATPTDMAAFQSFVTGRIRRSIRSPLYYAVLVLFGVIVGGLLAGLAIVRIHAPTAVVILVLGTLCWFLISRLYRSAVRPLPNGSLVGRRRIELDEAGIRQVADLHDAKTRWPGILQIVETPAHAFFMTDRLAGYIVPLHAFPDAAAREAFMAFARARATESTKTG